MRISVPVTDYIPASILTTDDDLVIRLAGIVTRINMSTFYTSYPASVIANAAAFVSVQTRYYPVSHEVITLNTTSLISGWCPYHSGADPASDVYLKTGSTDNYCRGVIGLNLPHGATITRLDIWLKYPGADGHDFYCRIFRNANGTEGAGDVMAEITDTIQHNTPAQLSDAVINNAVIDNSGYRYTLLLSENDMSRTDHVSIFGMLITYTITEPKP